MNLLDLDNDILNIIGDYVRADNERRISKEDDFTYNVRAIIIKFLFLRIRIKQSFVNKTTQL